MSDSSYKDLCARQVRWYLQNGRHGRDRIAVDNHGVEYVIGDFSWRCLGNSEQIEKRMDQWLRENA